MNPLNNSTSLSLALINELRAIASKYPQLPLCAIGNNKRPLGVGWQHKPFNPAHLADLIESGGVEVTAYRYQDGKRVTNPETGECETYTKKVTPQGFGVITGLAFPHNGNMIRLIAIDIDGYLATKKIDEILNGETFPQTVVFTSGRPGRGQWLFYVNEDEGSSLHHKKFKCSDEDELDFRYENMQSVLPPSAHPQTDGYKWLEGRSITECEIAELPSVFKDVMRLDLSQPLEFSYNAHTPQNSTWTDEQWALSYLDAIGSYRADDYDEWLKVGQALHSVSDSLLSEWDNWSRQSSKYKPGECESKWRSFSPSKGVGIGTLAHYAKQDGWRSPFERQPSNHTRNTSTTTTLLTLSLKEAIEEAKKVLETISDELTLNITLEDIRTRADISSYFWEQKIMKPLKREIQKVRFKLELQRIAEIEDKVEQALEISALAPKYCMNANIIQGLLKEIKKQLSTPQSRAYSLNEFLDLETNGLNFIVPGWLPAGETIILGGSPKAGKTLLSTDLAFAIATGETLFLGEKVKQGKVLIVQADESPNSTKSKLLRRGFRAKDGNNVRIIPQWDMSQMSILEEQLEDFRPDVVIIDSLRRIHHGSEISENSAEFADNIYTLKELLQRYNAAGVLIHHTNKDREALGVNRLRGSSAIAGSVWGVWHLDHLLTQDPENKKKSIIDPSDLRRTLELSARDSEGQRVRIELNPENNSWKFQGEVGISEEEQGKRKTLQERILTLLRLNANGLGGKELIDLLDVPPTQRGSVYATLNRLVNRRQISSKPATGDSRHTIYFIPQDDQKPIKQQENPIENNPPSSDTGNSSPPPSPPECNSNVIDPPKTQSQQEIEIDNKHITKPEEHLTPKPTVNEVLDSPNPTTVKVSKIDNKSETKLGGGESSQATNNVSYPSENSLQEGLENESASPTDLTEEKLDAKSQLPEGGQELPKERKQSNETVTLAEKLPEERNLPITPKQAIALLSCGWDNYIEVAQNHGVDASQLKKALIKATEAGWCERNGDYFQLGF